jgi:two-component system, chemotaxis family, sensor kinase CheA
MNEVIREFLIETHENLAQLDLDLVALEQNPQEAETLARAFRTLHTIKGTAGFLGLQRLQAVSHAAENLLSRLRDGALTFNSPIASALLGSMDAIRKMLSAVESAETDGDGDFSALIANLDDLRGGGTGRCVFDTPAEAPPASTATPPTAPTQVSQRSVSRTGTMSGLPSIAQAGDASMPPAHAAADSSIRVDVHLLDKLMNLVGELVLARNQVVQYSTLQKESAFLSTVQKLNLLTSELQAGVMKTRMQQISTIWSKFPRVVRDLAVACGKQARLEMDGQETELDKTIIEAIRDPLTHLVRNAVDHGIESPAARLAAGKPAEGRLALSAFHEGGKVNIEIADDGAGMDPQRIRAKAIQARLITPEQADRFEDRELVDLIFLPGFSTTDKVTQFSGRGVGMDVVRTNVEKIGGSVNIESRPGRGTTIKLKIPLTLAIIPALTVTSNGDRYAIPQVSLLELVHLDGEQAERGIELIHGTPVYRLRGKLLPLVYLDRQLKRRKEDKDRRRNEDVNIVLLQADNRSFGLVVDAIHDTEEIVVKPLSKQLKGINVFSGATIMGDGRVALILDVLGLAQSANVVSGVRERSLVDRASHVEPAKEERHTVLLFSTRDGGRMAIPLAKVARLEEFQRSAIEKVGPQDVVQYRNEIMPLLDVSRALRKRSRTGRPASRASRPAAATRETEQVVVYSGGRQRVGLVVDNIIDIVETPLASRSPAHRPGVLFTAVIQGRVTEFPDIDGILGGSDPAFIEQAAEQLVEA